MMADIARRGFESFAARLRSAWDGGKPHAGEAFQRVGRAYLAFAREEPATYSAMFESGLSFANHPGLHAASEQAFAVLCDACVAVIADMPGQKKPPALMVALHIWAQSHGIASLFARGDAAPDTGPRPAAAAPDRRRAGLRTESLCRCPAPRRPASRPAAPGR
jgi:hypothetical protein